MIVLPPATGAVLGREETCTGLEETCTGLEETVTTDRPEYGTKAGTPWRTAPGCADQTPSCRAAAATVCSSSVAMVIGPTPPGTGVISEARSAADSKSTSPTLPGL